ncbi:MAG: hypothetical protein ACRERU_19375 [Methylococcales bacterium]
MSYLQCKVSSWGVLLGCLILSTSGLAFDQNAELQRSLNAQVLGKPFSVADEKTLNASIEDATKRLASAKSEAGTYGRGGYYFADPFRFLFTGYRGYPYYYPYYRYPWRY